MKAQQTQEELFTSLWIAEKNLGRESVPGGELLPKITFLTLETHLRMAWQTFVYQTFPLLIFCELSSSPLMSQTPTPFSLAQDGS